MSRSKIYSDADYYLAGRIAELKYGKDYSHSTIAHCLNIDYYKVGEIVKHMHRGGAILINIHVEPGLSIKPKQLFCNESKLNITKWAN